MPGILEQRLKGADGEKDIKKDIKKRNPHYSVPGHNSKKNNTDKGNEKGSNLFPDGEDVVTKDDARELEEIEGLMSEEEDIKLDHRKKRTERNLQIVLSIGCLYMVILIYGAFITEFQYNEAGHVVPITLSVSDISDKNEFNEILGLYLQVRTLYEGILTLDYRMASGEEEALSIAPEYETVLDTVSSLTVKIDALAPSSKYNQVKNIMQTIVQTHMAAYCQYMSTAISQNDSNAASEAIACREVVSSSFQTLTQNIISLGEYIKGVDLLDVKDWSPDGYIQSEIEGITETEERHG